MSDQNTNPNKSKQSFLEENLSNLLLGLLTMLTVWIFNTTNETDKGLSNLNTIVKLEKQAREKNLLKFDKFLESPRFTKSDFDNSISPLIIQLNKNTDELNIRSDFIKNTNESIMRLEFEIKQLKKN
jgi:hypothetical protein